MIIKRLQLKEWILLDDTRRTMRECAERKEWSSVAPLIYKFIELACETPMDFSSMPWYKVVEIYNQVQEINEPTLKLPMFETKQKGKTPAWEYEGRSIYFWINVFASKYGWSIEEIEKMDIDSVVALWQEILVDDQYRQEWEWGLTEIAYQYNPGTKKSVFKPLPRPDWMLPTMESIKARPEKTMKIRRDMLPVGNIVSLEDDDASKNT